MMRLRSSSRCSRRLMPGNSALSVTAVRARSTMSVMMGDCLLRLTIEAVARQFRMVTRDRFEFRCFLMDWDHPRRWAIRAHCSPVAWRPNGQRIGSRFGGCCWDNRRGCDLLLAIGHLGCAKFFLNLHFELVAGAPEFEHQLAQLASDFRQLFGAKNYQRQSENEDSIRQTHCYAMIPAPPRGHKSPGQTGFCPIGLTFHSDFGMCGVYYHRG